MQLAAQINAALANVPGDINIFTHGHSLGGALSQLCANLTTRMKAAQEYDDLKNINPEKAEKLELGALITEINNIKSDLNCFGYDFKSNNIFCRWRVFEKNGEVSRKPNNIHNPCESCLSRWLSGPRVVYFACVV